MLIPNITLMSGKAVLLKQGLEKITERSDVLDLARYFGRFGEISLIDLDAALGNGNNEELIKQICKITDCRVGGGIRSKEKAERILGAGAKKIIIGTSADESFLIQLPKQNIIIALDVRNGKIATHGWTKVSNESSLSAIKRLEPFCSGFAYTNIEKTGTMSGVDILEITEIRNNTLKELSVAGGIASIEEILNLEKMNVHPQTGTCVYTGKIILEEAFTKCLNFEKRYGYLPTIVQDINTKQVLSLEYSTKESLKKALATGSGTYYNRTKNKILTKGETSGNTQKLISARYNGEMDAILFKVVQRGVGNYSEFDNKERSLDEIYKNLLNIKKLLPETSDLTQYFGDEMILKRKIMEKAFDMVNYEYDGGLQEKSAEMFYYMLTLMAKHNISPQDMINTLSLHH